MNSLIPSPPAGGSLTMSSLEISEVVNSRHDKVKQSIERLATRGIIQLPPLGEVKNHLGQGVSVYQIGKRDSYVVVAQLSPEFTARLVDRWTELEVLQQAPTPDSLFKHISPVARVVIEDLNGKIEHLESETHRLNSVCNDLAANLKQGLTPYAFCRMLNGVNLKRVQPLLVERKRLLKAPTGGYRSAAAYRGILFAERRGHNEDGRLCEKVVLTQKGAKWLYAEYEKGRLDMRLDWDGRYSNVLFDLQVAS